MESKILVECYMVHVMVKMGETCEHEFCEHTVNALTMSGVMEKINELTLQMDFDPEFMGYRIDSIYVETVNALMK